MKRWLVPLAAAAAVLVMFGGLWWLAGPDSRGDDTPFAGGDTRSGSDPTAGTACTEPDTGVVSDDGMVPDSGVVSDDGACIGGGAPGSSQPGSSQPGSSQPGSSQPGSPGTGEPGMAPSSGPVEPAPKQTNPMGVAIGSYHPYDADSLAVNYAIGVPECYGKIGAPVVEETARSVTVTLTRVPPLGNDDVACIDIALLKSVDIELSAPLGDRLVRDGAFDGVVVKPGPVPGEDDATY